MLTVQRSILSQVAARARAVPKPAGTLIDVKSMLCACG
jgi:hypothetical protein